MAHLGSWPAFKGPRTPWWLPLEFAACCSNCPADISFLPWSSQAMPFDVRLHGPFQVIDSGAFEFINSIGEHARSLPAQSC
jgi:hypothetical protein